MALQRATLTGPAGTAGMPHGQALDGDAVRTWELRRLAQNEAYGQYVAGEQITIAGVEVFQQGVQVPLEHVIRFQLDVQGRVNRVATPEMARRGQVFEDQEEFLRHNPHLAQARGAPPMGDLH